LSDQVTYFTNGAQLSDDDAEQLAARGIAVVDGRVAALDVHDDELRGVRLEDGGVIRVQVVAVMPYMVARARFLGDLGLQPVAHPSGVGEHIPVDATGRTDAPGVWAAGNVTDIAAQVGTSAAAGAFAAQQINADLVAEETAAAVDTYRQQRARA
jgi:thioredoxin reductase